MSTNLKEHFTDIADFVLNQLESDEYATISYSGEHSYFMRFKDARVRQDGFVEQASIDVKFFKQHRSMHLSLGLHFDKELDYRYCAALVENARKTILLLPEDPYFAPSDATAVSTKVYTGKLLQPDSIPATVLAPFAGTACNGLYAQGTIAEGVATSSGSRHWFESENFLTDYSVWLPNGRAVKESYSGSSWDNDRYLAQAAEVRKKLPFLSREPKKIQPGKYRAFITGNALTELAEFFHGFGAHSLNTGASAFIALKEGRLTFSDQFTLEQDFTTGFEPAFNSDGQLAADKLILINKGRLENILVSSRSAKQFNLTGNGAPEGEYTRAISILGGTLSEADALKDLDTGLYISSFNYLNWSDITVGRLTGMTRHACMWVENGVPVCPVADMRWDESLYNMFGKSLVGLTKETHFFANASTYGSRQTGGLKLPSILVNDFNCTL